MARRRLISPEFFIHYELYEAEKESGLPLRVAFSGLWTLADKRGVFRWRPLSLKLGALPYDEVDFAVVLDALAEGGFIVRYEVAGESYGFIPSFQKHQTFHRLEKPSTDPPPPASIAGTDDLLHGRQPTGWVPRAVREAVFARDRNRCVECKSTKNLSLDHVLAYINGGTNEADNLRVLCRRCNSKKGAKLLQGSAMTPQSPGTVAVPVTVAVAVAVTGTEAGKEPAEDPLAPDAGPGPEGPGPTGDPELELRKSTMAANFRALSRGIGSGPARSTA